MAKPHRSYRLSMKIEADTKEDLLHEIDLLHQRIAMDEITNMQGVVTIKNGMVYHVNGGTTKDD